MARSPPKVPPLPLPPSPPPPSCPSPGAAAAMMIVGLATLAHLNQLLPAVEMDHQFSISIFSGTHRPGSREKARVSEALNFFEKA